MPVVDGPKDLQPFVRALAAWSAQNAIFLYPSLFSALSGTSLSLTSSSSLPQVCERIA